MNSTNKVLNRLLQNTKKKNNNNRSHRYSIVYCYVYICKNCVIYASGTVILYVFLESIPVVAIVNRNLNRKDLTNNKMLELSILLQIYANKNK